MAFPYARILLAAIMVIALTGSISSRAEEYDSDLNWQIRKSALLCPDYFHIKDARAAARAGDIAWFHTTGCIVAKGAEKIILIDAPHNAEIWRGRVYVRRDSGGVALYVDHFDVLTFFALLDNKGGTSFVDFATRKEAEQWLDRWVAKQPSYRRDAPHAVRMLPSGRVQPLLGPMPFSSISYMCQDSNARCWMIESPTP